MSVDKFKLKNQEKTQTNDDNEQSFQNEEELDEEKDGLINIEKTSEFSSNNEDEIQTV